MKSPKIKFLAKKMSEAEMEARTTMEEAQKKEQRCKALNAAGYVVGSIALFSVSCAILPAVLSNISGALYKSSLKKANRDADNRGSVIERKKA